MSGLNRMFTRGTIWILTHGQMGVVTSLAGAIGECRNELGDSLKEPPCTKGPQLHVDHFLVLPPGKGPRLHWMFRKLVDFSRRVLQVFRQPGLSSKMAGPRLVLFAKVQVASPTPPSVKRGWQMYPLGRPDERRPTYFLLAPSWWGFFLFFSARGVGS